MGHPIKINQLLTCHEIEPVTEPSGCVSRLEYKAKLPNGVVITLRNNDDNFYLIGCDNAQEKGTHVHTEPRTH